MPRRATVVYNFTGGEVSPRANMRGDVDFFRRACKTIKNFIVRPQGGAVSRAGFARVPYSVGDAFATGRRIIPYRNGGVDEDLMLVMQSNGVITVWRQAGFISAVSDASGTPIIFPYSEAEMAEIEYAQNDTRLAIAHLNHPPVYIEFPVSGDETDAWLAETQSIGSSPTVRLNDAGSPIAVDAEWSVAFDTATWAEGDRVDLFVNNENVRDFEGNLITFPYSTNEPKMASDIEWALRQSAYFGGGDVTAFPTSGAPAGDVTILLSGGNADRPLSFRINGWPSVAAKTITVTNIVSGAGTKEPAWSYPYTVKNGANFYGAKVSHTSAAANEPGVGAQWTSYWDDLGTSQPPSVDYQHGGVTPVWASGTEYSKWGRGFPSVVTFYQQRTVLAATPGQPLTLWGSRIGNYDQFVTGNDDNDPYSFTLAAKDAARIQWMTELQGLSIGTTSGDWIIPGGITPTSIQAERVTGRHSARVRPVEIGPEIFYVEQGGKKLRRRIRNRDIQGYLSDDVSMVAEHIAARGIKRIAVQYVPETVIWLLLDDGQLACIAYDQNQGIAAWSDIPLNGTVSDLVSQYNIDGNDYIWAIIEFGGDRHLYVMNYPEGINLDAHQGALNMVSNPQVFSLKAIDNVTSVTVLHRDTGGEWEYLGSVGVLGGNVTIASDKDQVAFGLAYPTVIETLEYIGPWGVDFVAKRRWGDLFVRLFDSFRPRVQDQPTLPTTVRESVDIEVNALGYDKKGAVKIEQKWSQHTEIVGIYGNLRADND